MNPTALDHDAWPVPNKRDRWGRSAAGHGLAPMTMRALTRGHQRGRAFSLRAFSLIELLLVVGLLAVLGAVVAGLVPDFTGDEIDAAASRLATAAQRAGAEALATGRRVRLNVDAAEGLYFLTWEEDPVERPGEFSELPDQGTDSSRLRRLPDVVRFGRCDVAGQSIIASQAPPGSPARRATAAVTFTPDGLADSAVIELLAGEGDSQQRRWVLVRPAPAAVDVRLDEPDLPRLPDEDLLTNGEANPENVDLDGVLNFRGGLGGNNPNPSGSVELKSSHLSGDDKPASPPAYHGVYSTMPGS